MARDVELGPDGPLLLQQIEDAVALLAKHNIISIANLRHATGGRDIQLSPAKVRRFIENEYGLIADEACVPEWAAREWLENSGYLRCSGQTRKGQPCQLFVAGQMELGLWFKRHGELCKVHQEAATPQEKP